MAILFPVLSKAKAAAKGTLCSGNFKQLAVVNASYQGDYDGYIYRFYDADSNTVWYKMLGTEGYILPRHYYDILKPHILYCPVGGFGSGQMWGTFLTTGVNTADTYGYNSRRLRKPTLFVVNADAHNYHFSYTNSLSNVPTPVGGPYGSGVAFKHNNNSTNLLFADGHTEAWTLLQATSKWQLGTVSALLSFNLWGQGNL